MAAFADDNALQHWLQDQISTALELFVNSQDLSKVEQEALVKDSLTKAFNELNSGQIKKDARHLFK